MIDEKTDHGLPSESRGRSGLDKVMSGILRPGKLTLMIAGGMRPWRTARDHGKPRIRDLARAVSRDDFGQVAFVLILMSGGVAGLVITTYAVIVGINCFIRPRADSTAMVTAMMFLMIIAGWMYVAGALILKEARDEARSLLADLRDRVSQSRV